MKTAKLTYNAILAAMICIIAPFSVLIGAIPVSLATFAVYLISALSKPENSLACIIIYILLGAVGLPVFSGFSGGIQLLAGVTGGYIIGYLPCALIISIITNKTNCKAAYPLSMIAGAIICFALGSLWYMHLTKAGLGAAFSVCVLPFLPGEAIKIAGASILAVSVKPRLKKFI